MNTFFSRPLTTLVLTTAAAVLPAQVPTAPAAPAARTLTQLLPEFRAAGTWADGFRGLLALARQEQQSVLEAIAPFGHPGDDRDLTARTRLLIEAIATQHQATEKREELRQRFRRVRDAANDVEAAFAANASDEQKQLLAVLRTAVATLDKSLQIEGPLAPTPLRVPATPRTGPAAGADEPKADEPAAAGYREIEVDGKKMLVPAEALPPGTDYEAKMTEHGLVLKKKPGADAKRADDKPKDAAKPKDKPQEKPKQQPKQDEPSENGGAAGRSTRGPGGS